MLEIIIGLALLPSAIAVLFLLIMAAGVLLMTPFVLINEYIVQPIIRAGQAKQENK